ncbi:hypothetical protein Enr10x_30360 [Gimesia panareensis]|uniref:Uncharacterized protein n=1 Tax=Gimesia panareensis TaxID=2527978 RepID=A0A517Q7X6_9PLAN|nr:hypothetical protein Enr10x_30360 [Gimesia panareensis]
MDSVKGARSLDKRSEGEALSAALRLAHITSEYYYVQNLNAFEECFKCIIKTTKARMQRDNRNILSIPHLHFSAHGNEDGLVLTDNDFVPWDGLNIMLLGLGKATGYIGPSGYCLFLATFSTCNGAFASKMFLSEPPREFSTKLFNGVPPKPCIGIVGPTESVSWSDSLTAFVTFYHLNLTKHVPAQKAVKVMNDAAGLTNVFRCYAHDQGELT